MVPFADDLVPLCDKAAWASGGADAYKCGATAFAGHGVALLEGVGCAVALVEVRVA